MADGRSSVWDTINALKAKNSAAESSREREKESLRLRRAGIAVLERQIYAAAARGERDGRAIVANAVGPGRDAAVQAVLDDQRKVLREEGRVKAEFAEVVKLQEKAVNDLVRAKTVLCKVADDREAVISRAGRLEYKVRK